MKFSKSILFLLLFTTFINAHTNLENEPVVIGEKIIINSKILGQDWEIYVSLPEYYDESAETYPVILNLDGLMLFKFISANTGLLSKTHSMPDSIIVGVQQKNRHKELKLPESLNFLKFIGEEVLPYIETNYRTSQHRTIAGHSLGGTFVLTSLINQPELFDSYIAISPVIGEDNTPDLKDFETFLNKNNQLIKQVYLAKGNEKLEYFTKVVELVDLLKNTKNIKIHSKFSEFEKDNHGTVLIPAVLDAFDYLNKGWIMPEIFSIGIGAFDSNEELESIGGIVAIKNYYKNLSNEKGYEIKIPTIIYSRLGFLFVNSGLDKELMELLRSDGKDQVYVNYYLGQSLISQDKLDLAIDFLKLNSEINSESGMAWNHLAQTYQINKQFGKAKQTYEKAVLLSEKQHHPKSQEFKQNLEKLHLLMKE
jgi:predicted alpha/beta superfamily hydrolase